MRLKLADVCGRDGGGVEHSDRRRGCGKSEGTAPSAWSRDQEPGTKPKEGLYVYKRDD